MLTHDGRKIKLKKTKSVPKRKNKKNTSIKLTYAILKTKF